MRLVAGMMIAASWPAMAAAQQQPPAAPTPAPAPVTSPVAVEPQVQTQAPAGSTAVAAQQPATTPAPAAQGGGEDEDEIVVTGRRPVGSVVGDIPPEQVLNPADIRAYGVSNVSDLLNELAPLTTSGAGGAPVVLVDGKRISGIQEVRDFPSESILRVDILPEEVALKYGYTADQKVVNIVLRRRFRSTSVEVADTAPTEGGSNAPLAQVGIVALRNGARLNITTKYQQSSALTESERDIAAATTEGAATGFDQRPYRTLQPFTRNVSTNATYARPIGDVTASINAEVATSDSIGQFGLPATTLTVPAGSPFNTSGASTAITRVLDGGDFKPLSQSSQGLTAHVGTSLNGKLSERWQWTVTGSYDRAENRTFTETGVDATPFQTRLNAGDPFADPNGRLTVADVLPAAGNRARSTSNSGEVEALANGPLFSLPAGDVTTAIRVGADTTNLSSRSFRAGLASAGDISRSSADGRINLDLPIASRSRAVLGFLGNLSVNGNAAVSQLSDYGTLTSYGYGVNWAPITAVRLIGSINEQELAPSAANLGNPVVVTPNVRVFDFVQGQTVTVTTVTGGNPDLQASNRRVTRLGLTLTPWSLKQLSLTVSYTKQDVRDPIGNLSSPTAALAAAFPGRFIRDGGGNLIRVDSRPINFARSENEQIRTTLSFSKPLKSRVQRELEAFRAGTGPNPFAGMQFPGRRDRSGDAAGERRRDDAPPGDQPPPPGAERPAGDAPQQGDAPRGANDGGDRGPGDGGGRGFGGGGFGGGGRGGFGGRGGGAGQGRIFFTLTHVWRLRQQTTIADGGPVLDALNGDLIGGGSGQARHEFNGTAGITNNGLGAVLKANYVTGSRVNGGTPANPLPLAFQGLATADLRLFANLEQILPLVKAHPWVRGTRVQFEVDNILNSRQRVRDATGITPISYQPDYLDPLGRTIKLSIRKLFR
ncbi:TonB-dependent receptor [Sphingomonas sp. CLY1604]|uniref:TonB-dependent receptor n=1 Tax=Sphingomonas sp. CLY1604 TaxID=3457786 RepID=UPI003FD6C44A